VITQTKAELLKLRTTRTTLGLVLGMILLVVLSTLLTGLLTKHIGHLSTKEDQRTLFSADSLVGIFAALTGVLLVTSEYRHGTIRPTLLFEPRRSRVIGAKLITSALAGLGLGLLGAGLAFGIGYAVLAGRGVTFALGGGEVAQLVLGTAAGAALWGAIGVGLGTLVRNQVGGVIALLAFTFVIESLLFGLVPGVGRWLPSQAHDALVGLTTSHLVSPVAGAVDLIVWTAALAVAGLALIARRDVE
jgi:ABC-type transport system involved in multi-copper enzyme maturation permease subunit